MCHGHFVFFCRPEGLQKRKVASLRAGLNGLQSPLHASPVLKIGLLGLDHTSKRGGRVVEESTMSCASEFAGAGLRGHWHGI